MCLFLGRAGVGGPSGFCLISAIGVFNIFLARFLAQFFIVLTVLFVCPIVVGRFLVGISSSHFPFGAHVCVLSVRALHAHFGV